MSPIKEEDKITQADFDKFKVLIEAAMKDCHTPDSICGNLCDEISWMKKHIKDKKPRYICRNCPIECKNVELASQPTHCLKTGVFIETYWEKMEDDY